MTRISLQILSPTQLSDRLNRRNERFVSDLLSHLGNLRFVKIFKLVDVFLDPGRIRPYCILQIIVWRAFLFFLAHFLSLGRLKLRQLPGQEVLVSVVVRGHAVPLFGALMDDLDDLVHKNNDLVLETLGGL